MKLNRSFVLPVLVTLIALVSLGTSAVALNVSNQAAYQAPVARSNTTYNVTNGQAYFVFNGTNYTVTNGQVALDDAQYSYYSPLIEAGVLLPAGATGNNVFVNSSLARIATGGSLDVQSGATFTVSAPVNGNPAFAGNVTITGTSALVGAVTTTGAATVGGALTANGAVTTSGALVASGGMSGKYITATTAISVAALNVDGTFVSGMAVISASVTNGALVAHNLGVIPKVICQPISGGTATGITDTVWISATNTTSFTVGIIEMLQNKVSTDTVRINCIAIGQ